MLICTNTGLHSARPDGVRYDMVGAVDFFADMGYEALDANLSASIYRECDNKLHEPILDGDEKEWKARIDAFGARAAARGLPVRLSHLPFYKYADRESPDADFRAEMLRRSAEAAGMLGARWTVLHVDRTLDGTLAYARDICRTVNSYGVGVAVENSPRSTIGVLCESVDILKAEGYDVGVCFDTGHGNLTGRTQREMLTEIGLRLSMLHVHDNNGERDEHREIGWGNIDFDDVMLTLADIGYKGDFNYEVNATRLPADDEVRAEYSRALVATARRLIGIYNDRIGAMKK